MLKNRKQILISLPLEIAEWLEKEANLQCYPKGRFVEKILKEYREKEK